MVQIPLPASWLSMNPTRFSMNFNASELFRQETTMTTDWASELEQRTRAASEFLCNRLAYEENICVTSSFQAEDMVVVHMVREFLPRVPVLFLETGYHFPETITYRDRMSADWNLNLVVV